MELENEHEIDLVPSRISDWRSIDRSSSGFECAGGRRCCGR
ncbi:hypothetical protein THOE12_20560 [Vibrio rotiferianus]|nr:hypothetical protein THOE12_20560 [Vibrio rotiferianus]